MGLGNPADPGVSNIVLGLLEAAQADLVSALFALGFTPATSGQAQWPFAQRIAVETLAMDAGLLRLVAWSCAAATVIAVMVTIGAIKSRLRWQLWFASIALVGAFPWPSSSLVLTESVPTSFQRAPAHFDVDSIGHGLALYEARCAACHATDGSGETPLAARLPVWPPRLSGTLLWRRREGETFWRIRNGMHSRTGVMTMPGSANALSDSDTWDLIRALRVLGAGEELRREGVWPSPVLAPDFEFHCGDGRGKSISDWRGQRIRIVFANPLLAQRAEDPRLATVVVQTPGAVTRAQCSATSTAALVAYASLAGIAPSQLSGTEFIIDRAGWIRALARPGTGQWSESNLLCRATDDRKGVAASGDGLDQLIRRMDAEPITVSTFGVPHPS